MLQISFMFSSLGRLLSVPDATTTERSTINAKAAPRKLALVGEGRWRTTHTKAAGVRAVKALQQTSGSAASLNAWQADRPQTDDVSNSVGPTPAGTLSCAVCVVGQLARLELQSKVRHTLAQTHKSLAIPLALAPRALALASPEKPSPYPHPNPNTKVRHVVEPNLRAGHTIALLMVLSQGTPKYVNGRTGGEKGKIRLTEGPFALADERQLQASVWSELDSFRSNASNSTSRFSLRTSLEAETNLRQIDSVACESCST